MDKKKSNVKEKILQFIDNQEFTKQHFFSSVGLNYGNFTGPSKNASLSSEALGQIISKYPQLNPEWLLTGKGEMLREPPAEPHKDADLQTTKCVIGNTPVVREPDIASLPKTKDQQAIINEYADALLEEKREKTELLDKLRNLQDETNRAERGRADAEQRVAEAEQRVAEAERGRAEAYKLLAEERGKKKGKSR